ncbi:MAG: M14 family zinc carboxypeptidase [Flavobacteriaceae bacterium]|nr:M14 family zinc carboxypeptidase [Flavobacteriaceae bacterium]
MIHSRFLKLLIPFLIIGCNKSAPNPIKKSSLDYTSALTYTEVIDFYARATKVNSAYKITIDSFGKSDSGHPIHLVKVSHQTSTPSIKILLQNGIHPGEPDGIEASMLLVKSLIDGDYQLPQHIELNIIPVYNIGGMLQQNHYSRANQNGPEVYGFRGNAKNFDLNRDYLKADTQNTKAFYELFHQLEPHFFIDTHVSNGADYQYTGTHLFTHHNKLNPLLGQFLKNVFIPDFERNLSQQNISVTPYVNVFNQPIDESGFTAFFDHPRYSTGFVSLWEVPGMMIETHMLKEYNSRVETTLAMIKSLLKICEAHAEQLKAVKNKALHQQKNSSHYPIAYAIDKTKADSLNFLGYEHEYITSRVTGAPRLKFYNGRPKTIRLPYYNYYKATDSVIIPKAYLIPQAWKNIIDLMQLNNIEFSQLNKDSSLLVEVYRFKDITTSNTSYEGHFRHRDFEINISNEEITFSKGDYIIPTAQQGLAYLLESLEPKATDSFFRWNFFDTYLQQKEHFSPYVFEDLAEGILKENPDLNELFQAKKAQDSAFNNHPHLQLDWIYKNSNYYEAVHLRYPIFRIPKEPNTSSLF